MLVLAPYIVTNMFYIILSIFHFAEAIKKLLRKEFYGQKLLQKTDIKKLEVKCFHWACDLQGFNYRLQIQKYCCSTMFENMAYVIFILGTIVSSVQGNTLKYQSKATLLLLFFWQRYPAHLCLFLHFVHFYLKIRWNDGKLSTFGLQTKQIALCRKTFATTWE